MHRILSETQLCPMMEKCHSSFSQWLETWLSFDPKAFCLSKSTFKALISTLKGQVALTNELLEEGYEFVLLGKMQSDPLERRFSQYRQMSGGRFLVSLREVLSSEEIIKYKALLKKNIKFLDTDVKVADDSAFRKFKQDVDSISKFELWELEMSEESEEVSFYVAGYIGKKVLKVIGCVDCQSNLISDSKESCKYHQLLDRGELTAPSISLDVYIAKAFSILDFVSQVISNHPQVPVRNAALYVLRNFTSSFGLGCGVHNNKCRDLVCSSVVNIFYNNCQKHVNSSEKEEAVKLFKKRQLSKID